MRAFVRNQLQETIFIGHYGRCHKVQGPPMVAGPPSATKMFRCEDVFNFFVTNIVPDDKKHFNRYY